MKLKIMALSALAMLVVAPTANATPPYGERFSYYIEGQVLGSCGDFLVLQDAYVDLHFKVFFDKSGTPLREISVGLVDGYSKYYNSNDPNRFVEGGPGEVQVIKYEADGNTVASIGSAFRINLPSQGVMLLMVGRLVVDLDTRETLFEAGGQDLWDGNLDELCAALR